LIAQEFKKAGAKVTVVEGPMFFDELAKRLKAELPRKYDIVVHAAAVSDFKPQRSLKSKISSGKAINLRLVPTAKLINHFKSLAPESFLVGFKLESSLAKAVKDARNLFVTAGCDLVVANTKTNGYQGCIIDADGNVLARAKDKKNIAASLVRLLK
jgi:phosphopantothenoylcysteine synthetase/decarboxylase